MAIPEAARLMAEISKTDRAIKLSDVLDYMRDASGLERWAEGSPMYDSHGMKEQLLTEYPHLKDR